MLRTILFCLATVRPTASIALLILIGFGLLAGCDGDNSTSVNLPPPPVLHWDTVFVDGDLSLGEPFLDVNNNDIWDGPGVLAGFPAGEPYQDYSNDGEYQGPDDPWQPGIRWIDFKREGIRDGIYHPPDSIHQPGEPNYFVCVNSTTCLPLLYDCLLENEPMCFSVSATSLDPDLSATVEPNGFFMIDHSLVCWIPEGSGMQELTIIVRDSYWQTDTLKVEVYVSGCPGFD